MKSKKTGKRRRPRAWQTRSPKQTAKQRKQKAKVESEIAALVDQIIAARRPTYIFQGQSLKFGEKGSDEIVNNVLRSASSKHRFFTDHYSGAGLLILGPATEGRRGEKQTFIFEENEARNINGRAIDGYSSVGGRVLILKNGIHRNILALRQIAQEKEASEADPFFCSFVRYALSREIFGKDEEIIESAVGAIKEHELGHIKMKNSGGVNHTAFSNAINHRKNTLNAINEILADLNAIKNIVNGQQDTAHRNLLRMMTTKCPIKPFPASAYPASLAMERITSLLFHFVRPNGVRLNALAARVEQLEKELLSMADSAAHLITEPIIERGAGHLVEAAKAMIVKEGGCPDRALNNFAWEIAYGQIVARVPEFDEVANGFLPTDGEVRALFDFPQDGMDAWRSFLGAS